MKIKSTFTILSIYYVFVQLKQARSDKTYVIDGQERVTWDEAMDRCRRRGMELVSIESAEDNAHLAQLLGPAESSQGVVRDFWTSGRLTDGRWVWASVDRPFDFTDWAPGAPNDYLGHEQCVRLWGLHRFQWDDFFCKARMHFICQKAIPEDPYGPEADAPEESWRGELAPENPDFEYAKMVTIAGLGDDLSVPLAPRNRVPYEDEGPPRPAPPMRGAPPRRPVAPTGPDVKVLNMGRWVKGSSLTFVTDVALGWEEAKRECNRIGMEMAVIGDGYQAEVIRTFLQDNGGLDAYDYWIGFLHLRNGNNRTRSRRAAGDPMEPSVLMTIGLRPGVGSFVDGPVGHCPLMVLTDGVRLTQQECRVRHPFVCQRMGRPS